MKLSDVLVQEAIVYGLEARRKEEAITEMLSAVASCGRIAAENVEPLLEALIRRENLGTTGIGKGVAIPHAKHPCVEGIMASVGHSREGIEFASLDNQPVHTVFLFLASPHATGEHLAALERISMIVRDRDYWRFLRDAASAEGIVEIIEEADARFGK